MYYPALERWFCSVIEIIKIKAKLGEQVHGFLGMINSIKIMKISSFESVYLRNLNKNQFVKYTLQKNACKLSKILSNMEKKIFYFHRTNLTIHVKIMFWNYTLFFLKNR